MDDSTLKKELYFLIGKFLKNGPCTETFQVFIRELKEHDILPKRLDWTGRSRRQTFKELEFKYEHIENDLLLQICERIGPLLQSQFKKSISYVPSILGEGSNSIVREEAKEKCFFTVQDYSINRHCRSLYDPVTLRGHNFVKVLIGREISGSVCRKQIMSGCPYSNIQLLGRTLGHLSAVYCVLFDSSGKYIVTGADDLLVKIWNAVSGRLLCTLRGASAEITDLAINYENTLLAAGSVDKVVRVWCLQTAFPVATLIIHTGLITGVNFCPSIVNGCRYLASTATDGSVAFWKYATDEVGRTSFELTPVQYLERMRPGCAQILCGSFSAGGMFLATGSADHNVRVYKMAGLEGPTRVLEKEAHSDRVDSIQWAHTRLKFVSGSKDGTSIIWYYEQQQWKSKILVMSTKLPGTKINEEAAKQKLRVTMLSWDKLDQWVITASSDNTIKIWDSNTAELVQVLQGHKAETYVVESHPLDSKILLSAGHDGKIVLWNILSGEILASFQNSIDGQGFGAVFDAKWSPDGSMFAATDSHGQILTFGFGLQDITRKVPRELFFHTDYRPLMRDSHNVVLDEQTQTEPHLMPPPFLVDIDGNPYPPPMQRLVPGREHCDIDQLVPNVVLSDEGRPEVIMAANAHQMPFGEGSSAGTAGDDEMAVEQHNRTVSQLRTRVGIRRNGDIEGVRQSHGNWQRGDNILWTKRRICEPLDKSSVWNIAERTRSMAYLELEEYRRESKKPMVLAATPAPTIQQRIARRGRTHAYRTRASRTEQLEMEFENPENLTGECDTQDENYSTAHESELNNTSSDSSDEMSSSDYSDWTADNGINKLEPPKRIARVRRKIKRSPKFETPAMLKKPTVPQEIPEEYRPPDWLCEVFPKKAPYFPQMGDEVMFFQQGYNLYLNAVQNKNIYKVRPAQLNPWGKIKLNEPQLLKVIGIKYEIRPPRLCGLRLAVMDDSNQITPHSFDLKYHDITDVIDFLVLRQTYEKALSHNWKVGDRFRSMIDDAWWFGKITSLNKNAQSAFLCHNILWDNNETENLSPWDLEPLNYRKPQNGSSLPILPRELKSMLYRPEPDEWPEGNQDEACERILRGLEDLMSMSIAEHFLVPVDISVYPTYAYIVEYPIDLSTIKARLENRFYRRLAAVQFDARYIASNTEKFNEAGSVIVKHACIITEILLKIIKAVIHLDVVALCHQLQENNDLTAETTEEPEEYSGSRNNESSRNLRSRQLSNWKQDCKSLLQLLWLSEDSEPFRQPVDRFEHPDYDRIVTTPMDLSIIREDLKGNNYNTPIEFCDDIRLMFENAKNYTPNKRSRIYAMTVRLSSLAEEHMKRILGRWKNMKRTKTTASVSDGEGGRRTSRRVRRSRKHVNDDMGSDEYVPSASIVTRRTRFTNIGNKYPMVTRLHSQERSSRQSRREIKQYYSPKKPSTSINSSECSEFESRRSSKRNVTNIDSSGHTRNLRKRKLWNYAKMLGTDSDLSHSDSNYSGGGDGSRRKRRKRRRVVQKHRRLNDDSTPDGDADADADNDQLNEEHEVAKYRRVRRRRIVSDSDGVDDDQNEHETVVEAKYHRLRRRREVSNPDGGDNQNEHESSVVGAKYQRLRRRRQVCRYIEQNTDTSDEEEPDDDDDDDDEEDDDDDDEDYNVNKRGSVNISVSVSSRGRIRRLTAKARARVFRRRMS